MQASIGALPPTPPGARSSSPLALRPTRSAGGSIIEFDRYGDNAFRGIAVRGGWAVGSIGELTISGEHWPVLAPARPGPSGDYLHQRAGGRTTSLELGFNARIWDPFGLSVEGVVRYDAGGGDDQLRALVTYAPGLARAPRVPAEGSAVVYGMVRASGPWHFVEPGYALKLATHVTERDAAALTIALLHWQIPGQRLRLRRRQ